MVGGGRGKWNVATYGDIWNEIVCRDNIQREYIGKQSIWETAEASVIRYMYLLV